MLMFVWQWTAALVSHEASSTPTSPMLRAPLRQRRSLPAPSSTAVPSELTTPFPRRIARSSGNSVRSSRWATSSRNQGVTTRRSSRRLSLHPMLPPPQRLWRRARKAIIKENGIRMTGGEGKKSQGRSV